jgi:hypothetical protein
MKQATVKSNHFYEIPGQAMGWRNPWSAREPFA